LLRSYFHHLRVRAIVLLSARFGTLRNEIGAAFLVGQSGHSMKQLHMNRSNRAGPAGSSLLGSGILWSLLSECYFMFSKTLQTRINWARHKIWSPIPERDCEKKTHEETAEPIHLSTLLLKHTFGATDREASFEN